MATLNFDIQFKALFVKHYSELLVYAHRLVGDADAEDIVEEAYMNLWSRREEIEIGNNIRAFLYRTVYNLSMTSIKRRNLSNSYMQQWRDAQERYLSHIDNQEPNDVEIIEEKMSHLDELLSALPDQCREIFKLRYMHGMRNADIADALSISIRTVEAQLYKALKKLRSMSRVLCFILTL